MSVPVIMSCMFVQNLMKKMVVDTKHYHCHKFNVMPSFKLNYGWNVMQVVPLHHYPELIDQCCDLVNSEWKRSRTARMRSLESSCDHLPTNLILVYGNNVIGHSKLSVIPSMHDACYLESVVIDKKLRGKGYGKYLMTRIEEHCRNLGLRTIFLSTKDKVEFYEKLGYDVCAPVSIYGQYLRDQNLPVPVSHAKRINAVEQEHINKSVPPPPPPPPDIYLGINTTNKTFMSKPLQ